VADGRHSTGLTAKPWKILAIKRELKLGDHAAQSDVAMNMMALPKYTGRLPKRIAVGENMTEPMPMPIM
jgi:hypothetical protein